MKSGKYAVGRRKKRQRMKKKILKIRRIGLVVKLAAVVIASSFLLPPSSVFAAFNDSGWGVRPLGMGGAFSAIANDANAPLYNPAGIVQPENIEMTFMSAKLFTGLEGVEVGQNYFSYVNPISDRSGSIGLTWASLYDAGIYKEDEIAVSYAHDMDGVISVDDSLISVGINVKYLHRLLRAYGLKDEAR